MWNAEYRILQNNHASTIENYEVAVAHCTVEIQITHDTVAHNNKMQLLVIDFRQRRVIFDLCFYHLSLTYLSCPRF